MKPVRLGIFATSCVAVLSHEGLKPWAAGILEAASGILLLIWAVAFLRRSKRSP